jgi:hypothetical protein
MDAPEAVKALFPHVRQAALIERYVTRKVRKRKKGSRKYRATEVRSAVAVFVITSLDAREAAPAQGRPHQDRPRHPQDQARYRPAPGDPRPPKRLMTSTKDFAGHPALWRGGYLRTTCQPFSGRKMA